MDVVTTQKLDQGMDMAAKLMAMQINDEIEQENKERAKMDWYSDKGPGIPKPKENESEMD